MSSGIFVIVGDMMMLVEGYEYNGDVKFSH